MFILDKPYVSETLLETTRTERLPVIQTESARQWLSSDYSNWVSESEAVLAFNSTPEPKLYSNSENAIDWIEQHLASSKLLEKIGHFKNKTEFRVLTKALFPDLLFQEFSRTELFNLDISNWQRPFILKPSIGFFSLGVYKIIDDHDWHTALASIKSLSTQQAYPESVLNHQKWLIESCIEGEEFAIDAYFDEVGEVVVLGLYHHVFSSDSDVSDRVYTTSVELYETYLHKFSQLIQSIGELTNLRNFPVHVELRVSEAGEIIPIEINPLRFGGWCTTADMTQMAFNINPYLMYIKGKRPDWPSAFKNKHDLAYHLVVLDNSSRYEIDEIESFNYELLEQDFSYVMALRKVDFKQYNVFGFVFVETNEKTVDEINHILVSDLEPYIIPKQRA